MRPYLTLIITAMTTAVLYAPQPLLPVLSADFSVGKSSTALLVSLTLAPLALAPLLYGYVLELCSPIRIIRVSILILALSEAAFAFCWSFPVLLAIRIIQGFAIPAILTSLMTNISVQTPVNRLQRIMAFYIAATITGGFLGRLSSGVFASYLGWRPFFVILGLALTGCFLWVRSEDGGKPAASSKPELKILWSTFLDKRYQRPFIITFCSFFVLASVMNFIPFRLVQIDSHVSELLFGFIYTGYLAGVFSVLMAGRIKETLKSDENCIVTGLVLLVTSLFLLLAADIVTVLLTLFLLSGAMFLVHVIAANKVNHQAVRNKGIVNGLYISSYYTGGALGSYFPGLIYEHYDWPPYIASLILVVCVALNNAIKMKIRR